MCIIPWSPLSRSLRSLRFRPGNAGGMLWIFLLGCVLRAPLRPKDLPVTLPLDAFFPAAGLIGGDARLEGL